MPSRSRDAVDAAAFEVARDDLGVRAGAERRAAVALQPRAQLGEVVDLAVVGDDDRVVAAASAAADHHGLRAPRHVDDRQPAVPDRDLPAALLADPRAFAVRAPVSDAGEHARQSLGLGRVLDEPRDAAHEVASLT